MISLEMFIRSFLRDDCNIDVSLCRDLAVEKIRYSLNHKEIEIQAVAQQGNSPDEVAIHRVQNELSHALQHPRIRLVCRSKPSVVDAGTRVGKKHTINDDPVARARAHEIKLLQEAQAIIRTQKQKEKADSQTTELLEKALPNELSKDSWAYKASRVKPRKAPKYKRKPTNKDILWGKMTEGLPKILINQMDAATGLVHFDAKVEIDQLKLTRSGTKVCAQFFATDDTGSIPCIGFFSPEDADKVTEVLGKKGAHAQVQANVIFDAKYSKDLSANLEGLNLITPPSKRVDKAQTKRVELHCHSKMSEKDAVINISELMTTAAEMGHPACAITDHGVVQGFPEAAETVRALRENEKYRHFKAIYGMEGYLVDDGFCVVYNLGDAQDPLRSFTAIAMKKNEIAHDLPIDELVAMRYIKNEEGFFSKDKSFRMARTAVGSETVCFSDATSLLEGIRALADFLGDAPVCGEDILQTLSVLRNIGFDVDIEKHEDFRVKFNPTTIDIGKLKLLFSDQNIETEEDQTASDIFSKAKKSGQILSDYLRIHSANTLSEINERAGKVPDDQIKKRKHKAHHIIFLVENNLGLYHLYRLVSESHLHFCAQRPRIPKSLVEYFRSGLIIGSACEAGEIFSRIYTHYTMNNNNYDATCASILDDADLCNTLLLYDYLEIQPTCNNEFYLYNPDSGLKSEQDLKNLNRLIVYLGEKTNHPVCATTDAHFLERREGEFRKYMLMDMEYKDAERQSDLYYRTTDEMFSEFSYLGEEKVNEVVVTNPNRIAEKTSPDIIPFPNGTFPPNIDHAADDLRRITWSKAEDMYLFDGQVAAAVSERVHRELDSIIGNGFAIMYYISFMLVKKSNEDGYIVGSRGSVGSSLVAYLCGISEVNPLPPHHLCPKCRYSEFISGTAYGSGFDLPKKDCPHCDAQMIGDGQEIPFETFLGFFGDKQPDIDLNFSSEYQARAHKYVEVLFGKSHTFRAGTISCYAEKNAIATVLKIADLKEESINRAELRRRARGLIGVKRTTGQHPGGIVVVPKEMDIYEFTPIQYPANKAQESITTHFDFKAMHDTILKLDILGHYDPTVLRMLSDLTGVDVRTIPIPDEKVMSLLISTDALGIAPGSTDADSGTLGLSEMGTFMARDMIAETKPASFFELVQLMGLSHGTDVWKGNAQDLIQNQTCTLKNVIGCRDSIMTYLISCGFENKVAFDIMEKVRKGKGLTDDQERLMIDKGVPQWYIESCKKIKYMFPKAHAAAYAISSLRIAWFKVYYPEEYYCAYFSIRADDFDGSIMCKDLESVRRQRMIFHEGFSMRKQKEQAQHYLLEIVEEMYMRNIAFESFDIERSHSHRFIKTERGKILPPLNALPSISTAMAQAICAARDDKMFSTREDLAKRSRIGPGAVEKLASFGILDHLPESEQIDIFSFL